MSPQLDVTEILTDPDFASTVAVLRNTQTIGSNGLVTVATETFEGVIAVVTVGSPNDLNFGADEQHQGKSITVVTRFRLRGVAQVAGTNYQPDVVVWNGDQFKVVNVGDWTGFGGGFVEAEAESIDFVDAPPSQEPDPNR